MFMTATNNFPQSQAYRTNQMSKNLVFNSMYNAPMVHHERNR